MAENVAVATCPPRATMQVIIGAYGFKVPTRLCRNIHLEKKTRERAKGKFTQADLD